MFWRRVLASLLVPLSTPARCSSWAHGCAGPYARLVVWTAPAFTTLTVWLAYQVARRWVRQPYALEGALVGAFGTTLVTYGAPDWFYRRTAT